MPSTAPQRAIPLFVDNKLPAVAIRFRSTDDDEVQFYHVGSCAGMNTGNLLLSQWIVTNHSDVVESYEEYYGPTPVTPLKLDCVVPTQDEESNLDNLTTVITYKTRYKKVNSKHATLCFGFGKGIQVNAIIGIP